MSKVILVSPPYMEISKPPYDLPIALTKGCRYMNPGLLISAAILDKENISNEIVKVKSVIDFSPLENAISSETILVGISCTSAWEYLESLRIASFIKKTNCNIKILISGWQIKSIKSKVFDDSSDIDFIVLGDAENTVIDLYKKIEKNLNTKIFSVIDKGKDKEQAEKVDKQTLDFIEIDFSKYPDYKSYSPYVEESRNCPFSCNFCLNSCVDDKYKFVPLEVFKRNVENVEKLYGRDANVNLLAANFGVDPVETKKKLDFLKSKSLKWNIELHVDNPWELYIGDLKKAGVRKASIGFESGSKTVLNLMNKTKNPERYLARLRNLLSELYDQEISADLNLLFDHRETSETMKETLEYLNNNKHLFNRVKANFMFAFEGIFSNIDFNQHLNIVVDDYGKLIHAYPLLPHGFNLKKMTEIIDSIESGNYSSEILNLNPKKMKR